MTGLVQPLGELVQIPALRLRRSCKTQLVPMAGVQVRVTKPDGPDCVNNVGGAVPGQNSAVKKLCQPAAVVAILMALEELVRHLLSSSCASAGVELGGQGTRHFHQLNQAGRGPDPTGARRQNKLIGQLHTPTPMA